MVVPPDLVPLPEPLPLPDPEAEAEADPSLPDLPSWVSPLGGDLGGVGRPVSLSIFDTGSSCFSPSGPRIGAVREWMESDLAGEVGDTGE